MKQELDTLKKTSETIVQSINDTILTKSTKITYDLAQNQSDSIPYIVIEYIKVLIWPTLVIFLIIVFKGKIERLFDRIINESDEIGSTSLGLIAKFRHNIHKVSTDSDDSQDFKTKIESTIKENYIDEFKLFSSYFFTKSFQARKQAAAELYKITQNITIEDLLPYVSSPLAGERVGAFIGIKAHIDNFSNLAKDERISDALRTGLDDGYSRVRYRVVQAISSSDYLIKMFSNELETLHKEENSKPVKKEIVKIIK